MIKLNPDCPKLRLIRFHLASVDREQLADIVWRRFKFKWFCLLFLLGIVFPDKCEPVPTENQLARKGLPRAQIYHRKFARRGKIQRMAGIFANPLPKYLE